jgi:hypothetical protein
MSELIEMWLIRFAFVIAAMCLGYWFGRRAKK